MKLVSKANEDSQEDKNVQTFNGYKAKYRSMFGVGENADGTRKIYNGVDLKIDNSFGCLSLNIQKNGMFISENDHNIIFPSGDHLARYDILTRQTDFVIREKSRMGVIECITSGLSKKSEILIGIGEKIVTESEVIFNLSIFCCDRQKWIYCEHFGIPNLTEN